VVPSVGRPHRPLPGALPHRSPHRARVLQERRGVELRAAQPRPADPVPDPVRVRAGRLTQKSAGGLRIHAPPADTHAVLTPATDGNWLKCAPMRIAALFSLFLIVAPAAAFSAPS